MWFAVPLWLHLSSLQSLYLMAWCHAVWVWMCYLMAAFCYSDCSCSHTTHIRSVSWGALPAYLRLDRDTVYVYVCICVSAWCVVLTVHVTSVNVSVSWAHGLICVCTFVGCAPEAFLVIFVNCVCVWVCVWADGGWADFLCSGRNRQCLLASFQFVGGRVRDGNRHNREGEGEMRQRHRKHNNESDLK